MSALLPLVSVLVTAFNREAFIASAIQSVLASSLHDFELIVVDDASTDGTVDVAARYASDPRVRIFRNDVNLGDYPNRNRAAACARGKYIKYVDSDDTIYPEGLATMANAMEQFGGAGLGISAEPDGVAPFPRLLSPHDAYVENYWGLDILARAPGSAIILRSAFESVGGFSGRRQVGDHELWLKIAAKYPVVKLPAGLVWDRLHPDQEKNYDDAVDKAIMHDEVRVEALRSPDCPLSPSERDRALERLTELRARQFWVLLRGGVGMTAARDYKRRLGIPVRAIALAAYETAVPAARERRDSVVAL